MSYTARAAVRTRISIKIYTCLNSIWTARKTRTRCAIGSIYIYISTDRGGGRLFFFEMPRLKSPGARPAR